MTIMMRLIPMIIAIGLLAACDEAPRSREQDASGSTVAAVRNDADSGTATALRGGENPAAAPAAGAPSADGAAELRRLAAAGKPILLPTAEEVAAGEFVADTASSPSAYAGDYRFGDSEGESTLSLTVRGNAVTGGLGYASWENETWVGKEVRLDGGTIVGSTLTAPGWSGVFVRFRGRPGLVILKAPDILSVEFGEKLDTP
jgi:hypothetical protein